MSDPVLVTGVAGFIGFHTALRLLQQGRTVVGVDNLNDYYDINLKHKRLEQFGNFQGFSFVQADISDKAAMERLWAQKGPFKEVVHLAAQAGVRYSLENPYAYITSNCMGHLTILEMCRHTKDFKHLVYASSSSVYGGNTKLPFSVRDPVEKPISLYAATKRADELMSHSYAHLFGLPQTGLRFFTVYGPWGRPDMALFIFTKAIKEGRKVPLYNGGKMMRDFTYIDDIVDGVVGALGAPLVAKAGQPPCRVFNLGNNKTESLMRYLALIEAELGRKADIDYLPMQAGDVQETCADVSESTEAFGFLPKTSIEDGVPRFIRWYNEFYG
jgi:UDP-glucuronate 4-epimerase